VCAYHQLASHDTLGETGEVLNLGGSGQLTAGSNAVGHETLIENSYSGVSLMIRGLLPEQQVLLTLQLSSRQVDSSRMGSRP
jgi:hypothetical protein